MILASLGGTLITNMLLGQPASWMTSDAVLPTYIVVFALDRYCPGDLFHRLVSLPPLFFLIQVIDNVSWVTDSVAFFAGFRLSGDRCVLCWLSIVGEFCVFHCCSLDLKVFFLSLGILYFVYSALGNCNHRLGCQQSPHCPTRRRTLLGCDDFDCRLFLRLWRRIVA